MADATEYRLRLYVTGGTGAGERAVRALRNLRNTIKDTVHSEVVDVLLHPELVLDLACEPLPVLVREEPLPVVVYRGAITEPEQIAAVLKRV
jgi:hypothetical protein